MGLWVRVLALGDHEPGRLGGGAGRPGGAIAGYIYWYGPTILAAPWYYWVFVPDCPLAATFMGVALLGFHFGRRWDFWGCWPPAPASSTACGPWSPGRWTFARGDPLSLEGVTMASPTLS